MNRVIDFLKANQIEYWENEPMALHTTFKIGGAADILITPDTVEKLKAVLSFCDEFGVPYMVLGKGSNLLVSDDGIAGAVISTEGFCELEVKGNKIICGAGVSLAALCKFALKNSLSGLEFAYGIPGSVGGAVYMNAGAYGGEMKDVISSVTYMTDKGEIKTAKNDELDFSYRHSAFSGKNYVVLSAEMELNQGETQEIDALMEDILGRRLNKQPLNYPSAGSVFKRPQGSFAGTLIEGCALKGYTIGGAQVSEKHAGFIINIGGATCADVLALVAHIQNTVNEQHGIMLEPEIIKIGR